MMYSRHGNKLGRKPSKVCPRGHDMSIHRVYQSGRPWCGACKNGRWKLYRYNASMEQLDEMAAAQGERCAICRKEWDTQRREPCVDHDHKNGVVRALLCRKCNIAIGHLNDDPALMRAAAAYMEKQVVGHSQRYAQTDALPKNTRYCPSSRDLTYQFQ